MAQKHIFLFLLGFLILVSCEEREFQNPFDPQVPKTLSILVSPREAGRINASPISSIYATDELVTLTPEANENWVFQNWEGDVSGNSVPMSLTMDSNKSVTAVFVRKNYSLIVTIQGEGTVSEAIVSSPSGREYPHGTTVRLTPVPKEGWVFESWSGDLTGTDAPKNITVDKEKNVTAKFKRIDYPLIITIEGEGTVEERIVSSPNSRSYPFETVVELTPLPKEGWVFDSWGGDLTGADFPKNITVDNEKDVIAKFKRRDYPLNITIEGEGIVEERIVSSPNARSYPFETVVELTPVANEGWVFISWDGDLTGSDYPQKITFDKEKNVTARFFRPAVTSIDCQSATDNGDLIVGRDAFDVSSSIPYSGGDGTSHTGQTVQSTGVTGLTATLAAGNFTSGSGVLTYTITGKPNQEGTASFALNIGDRTCVLTRTVNPVGSISALNCDLDTNYGRLIKGVQANSVNSKVPYTGGNGSVHDGQIVQSTGVTGLTATLAAGSFANGSGTLSYAITGTPNSAGNASFALNIGGKTCALTLVVRMPDVYCASGPTEIVEVINPVTGKIWMDRNLGASRVATSATDSQAYGDLYQWGRRSDGHQCRNSEIITTMSSTSTPVHNQFIIHINDDWLYPSNNDLWQGTNGVNNPCPNGYRLPTSAEWTEERNSWVDRSASSAFAFTLKLTKSGSRGGTDGSIVFRNSRGLYHTSTLDVLFMIGDNISSVNIISRKRINGNSVRCIKNY